MDFGKILRAINSSPPPNRTPHGWVAVPLGVAHSNIDTIETCGLTSQQMHESEED